MLRDRPLDFAPGTRGAYSNTNYMALDALVATVTGRSLAASLRAHVFGPLGMRSEALRAPTCRSTHGPRLRLRRGRDDAPARQLAGCRGHRDARRRRRALLHGAVRGRPRQPRRTPRHDAAPGRPDTGWDGYGLGPAQHRTCGTAYGHSGHIDGYVAQAWTVPGRDSQVVALANRDENGGSGRPLQSVIDEALCD